MRFKSLPIAGMALAMICAAPAAQAGTNLLVNGDFSAGATGFSTDYTLTIMTPFLFQDGVHGIFAVLPAGDIAASSAYGDWTNVSTDPFGGNGNVYLADGATDANTTVWSETVNVTPNTNYSFSFYGVEVSNPCCSNANLQSTINGDNASVINTTNAWQKSGEFIWNSGSNTTATLSVTDTNTDGSFNDFAMTDLSFSAPGVPEPSAWAMMILGAGMAGAALRRRRVLAAA